MTIVHSYLRFSSRKQEQGDSKRRQRERSDEWITRNGHTLSPLRFEDLGVSAFRGKNKETGALRRFLLAIEDGHVKPGEILLIEALDRLSRQGVADAFALFNQILTAGVSIAVLAPTERIYTRRSINDLVGLLEPLMSFHLAYEESKKKSDRLGRVWQQKRKRAQETGKPLNRKCPAWLKWNEEKSRFEKRPEAAKAIRYIFQRTVDGVGQRALIKELTERFAAIGQSGHWNSSYIQKVLNDRAVLGELQLRSFVHDDGDRDRVPQGPPIADYYPRIIDDALWYRAQESKATRQRHKGPNSNFFSLFTNLVKNARDGHTCQVQTTRDYTPCRRVRPRRRQRRLISYGHARKLAGSCPVSIDYYLFEASVLAFLSELTPSDLLPAAAVVNDDVIGDKEAELHGVEARLTELQEQLQNPATHLPTIVAVVKKLELKRDELKGQLEGLKREQATSAVDPIGQTQSLLELLQTTPDDREREIRQKLRVLIPTVIESIYVVPVRRPKRHVVVWIQINLRCGKYKQIFCSKKHVVGMPEALDSVNVDLRDPRHVAKLVKQTERIAA